MRKNNFVKILALVCLTALSVACFCACNDKSEEGGISASAGNTVSVDPSHEHTFAEDWTYDADYHWHAATCGHFVVSNKTEHEWGIPQVTVPEKSGQPGEKQYSCTVCGYTKKVAVASTYAVQFFGHKDGKECLLDTQYGDMNDNFVINFEPTDGENEVFVGWDKGVYDERNAYWYITPDQAAAGVESGNLIVTANYAALYDVKFLDYENDVFYELSVREGTTITAPTTEPEREGYAFTGWDYDFDVPVTSHLTVYSQYDKTFVVTYLDNDGDELMKETVINGAGATYVAPEKYGHDFVGWSKDLSHVTEDTTVTATYKLRGYIVNFFAKGLLLSSQAVDPFGAAVEPEINEKLRYDVDWPTYKAYEFSGWDKAFSCVTGNTDVTAQYKTEVTVPVVAVKTNTYKNVTIADGAGDVTLDVSFVLFYSGKVGGLSIGVRQNSSLLVYDSFKLFPTTTAVPGGHTEYSTSKDESETESGVIGYCEEISWSSSSQATLAVDERKEILRITYKINAIEAKVGTYWIYVSNTYFVNEKLEKIQPIVISDFVGITSIA